MKIKILLITYAILFGVFVYPSFRIVDKEIDYIDCIAGCRTGVKGIPFSYVSYSGSGVVGGGGSDFSLSIFVIDALIWLLAAFLIKEIIIVVRKKISN